MTMQFRVVHTTRISYDGGVAASYNLARMTPPTTEHQVVVHTRLDVAPTPWSQTYRDYWGTEVTAFEVLDQHSELAVTATSTVQVNRPSPVPGGLTWEQLRTPELQDRFCETLVADDRVRPDDDLRGRVLAMAEESTGPSDFARRVCQLVWDEMKYVSGSTKVHGHAQDAWAARKGVCQDMAHITLGALREVGIPARYVSGYLHPKPNADVGQAVAGESHAWIEWFSGEWQGFDPTNNIEIGDRHVLVGRGRDYNDVPPLRGVYAGPFKSHLHVKVTITREA